MATYLGAPDPVAHRLFEDIVASYPAERNVQKLFFIACSHPDKDQARKLLPKMREEPSREILGANVPVFRLCVDWAAGKFDEFIMRDPDTGVERWTR